MTENKQKQAGDMQHEPTGVQEFATAVIGAIPEGLIVFDMDGKVIAVNPAVEKISGYRSDELVGKNAADVAARTVKPEDRGRVMKALGTALEGKVPVLVPITMITKDGQEVPVSLSVSLIKDTNGRPTHIVAVHKDLTDFKRAEEERENSIRDQSFLAKMALEVVELPLDHDIYKYLAAKVKEITEDSVVSVGVYNEATNSISPRVILGMGKHVDMITKIFGSNPFDMTFPVTNTEAMNAMITVGLKIIPNGLYDIVFGKIPRVACQTVEKLLNLGASYAIGVRREKKLFGNVIIMTRRGTKLRQDLIEILVNHVSVVLERNLIHEDQVKTEVLSREKEFMDKIIDLNPYAMQIYKPDGFLNRVNAAYQKMFGGTPPPEYNFFDDPYPAKEGFTKANIMQAGFVRVVPEMLFNPHWINPKYPEADPQCPDKLLCFSVTVFSIMNAEGQLKNFVVMLEDITGRKRAEEELKRQAGLINSLLDSIPDIIFFKDINGVYLGCNPPFAEFVGRSRAEIIGKTDYDLFDKEVADFFREHDRLMLELRQPRHNEEWITYPDGRKKLIDTLKTPYWGPDGTFIGVLGVSRDITERKRAQDEITAARDYTDNIIKSMIDTLIVVDPNAKIRTVNKATSDLLGYTEDELIGKPVATIFAEEEEEEELLFKGTRLQKLIEEGSIRDYDMTYRTKSGEHIPVSFSGSVMYESERGTRNVEGEVSRISKSESPIPQSKIVGIVGIARDMREIKRLMQKEKELAVQAAAAAETDRKRASELEKAYKELESAQEKLVQAEKLATVGRLAAGVAHEINNPLAAIMISVQRLTGLIKNEGAANIDSEVYVKTLELVERATNNCKGIVTGLLAFSRPIKLQLAHTDIHKVVEESLEVLEGHANGHKVRVVNDFAPHSLIIQADKHKLIEVFNNLIINACEAMPEGGQLSITTRLQQPGTDALRGAGALDETGKMVEIEFNDTGEGILEEDMFEIFDPFFSTKETGKSVGLGLSISYGIIQQHGGAIEVSSKKGEGSTFIVRLPVDGRNT